ncbi:MAG: DUF975 family protein [Oscillospiraceae bacterium]|nr:DUF975 family protein [Oscillospiraceae bacterium]
MLKAADFRKIARDALKGNWLVAVGTGFIASLLGGCIMFGGGGSGSVNVNEQTIEQAAHSIQTDGALMAFLFTALAMVSIIAIAYAVVLLIIGGAVSLGYAKFNLNLINRNSPKVEDVFSQFKCFKSGFAMYFLRGLYTFLWMLLFIVPGIIASYSYAMAPYILYENPDMTGREALAASKELMCGNKWRLFCLEISFIGWSLLSAITLGIGFLFLRPYIEAAGAAFYREIKWEKMKQQAGM